MVDFTVTLIGLEDQLLGKLILKEKHELEEQRQQLMEEVQSYKKKIKQLEDDLLFRLSNSQGRWIQGSRTEAALLQGVMILFHLYTWQITPGMNNVFTSTCLTCLQAAW